jgi:hypothetical protein
MLSSASLKLCHMCGHIVLKQVGLGKGWGQRLVGMGQLIFYMGPELSEVRTLH